MLPGSLEAGPRALLASSAKPERVAICWRAMRRMPHVIRLWFRRVEARRALARLDDHLLHDIGMTRGDVERALLRPFWRE
jgi:uncharacterized protein YjiS (DUF1127 family)